MEDENTMVPEAVEAEIISNTDQEWYQLEARSRKGQKK